MSEAITGDKVLTDQASEKSDSSSPKRAAIVCAAADLFLHSGYGAVSMDNIAAEAEVSKRTVYSHFPGKDVLFAAVMTNHCNQVSGIDTLQLDPEAEPEAVLGDLGRRFLLLITSEQAVALFRTVVAEAGRFPELGQTFYDCGPTRWVAALSPYLAEQDRRGRLKVPDVEAAAAFLLYRLKDPLHMRCILGVQETPSDKEIREHVAAAVAGFLKIYAPT